ncbi:NHR domain-containing protein [Durusdinium trenchii]|uniref:NHR domain-containing protein n=1 Tax=Durusdinium trenchii TaxID=1381693 RepID=A0ABP0MIQ9_9DINO
MLPLHFLRSQCFCEVVDAVPWHGQALIAIHDLTDSASLAECLKELHRVQHSLDSVCADEVLEGLAPLIEVISGQDSEDELNYKDFRRWVADLEEQQLTSLREAGEGHHGPRLVDAPLSNFPLAMMDVDEEESVDGKEGDRFSGIGDGEGLLAPHFWQNCLDQVALTHPELTTVTVPIQALEAPTRSRGRPEVAYVLLPWLARRLRDEAHDLAEPAALALELMCVGDEEWPGTGVFPRGDSEDAWPRDRLIAELSGDMVASGAAALGLCHICLASARPEILERCLFWANGMVGRASTVGWQEVISWIRDRLGDALPPSSLPWREALDETCGGLWLTHQLFREALKPESSVAVRDVFDAALELFPKVLPWNIVEWMAWTFEPPTAAARLKLGQHREALLAELPLYFMRLLPTCTRACDEPLLREAFAVTLHRRPSEVGAIPLHAGRCSAADSLLCRFRKKLDIELCHHMRYPLGVLLLSQPETSPVPSPSKSCLEQLRDLNRSVRWDPKEETMEDPSCTQQFDQILTTTLKAAAMVPEEKSLDAISEEVCQIDQASFRGDSKRLLRQDGRINTWYDLALALRKLAGLDPMRWQSVLEHSALPAPPLMAQLAALAPSRLVAEAQWPV